MKKVKIDKLNIFGTQPETEEQIPTTLQDMNVQADTNVDIQNNTISVRKSTEFIAGGVYYWQDQDGYWHLTTTGSEPIIEYEENENGTTAIIEARDYVVQPNNTGDTVII